MRTFVCMIACMVQPFSDCCLVFVVLYFSMYCSSKIITNSSSCCNSNSCYGCSWWGSGICVVAIIDK